MAPFEALAIFTEESVQAPSASTLPAGVSATERPGMPLFAVARTLK